MDIKEVVQYITLSGERRVCIHREPLNENNGFMLSIYIQKGKGKYEAEFVFDEASNLDAEGSPSWVASYDELRVLVVDLEKYLDKKIKDWENYT